MKASCRNNSEDYTKTEQQSVSPGALARWTDSTAGQGHITPLSLSQGTKAANLFL